MANDIDPLHAHEGPVASPRADFVGGLIWMALAVAILIGSITMDRLEDQDINPYTIPGLLPGLLSLAMLLFGTVLMLRSIQRGALTPAGQGSADGEPAARGRIALVIGLCVAFAVLLVGRGLPFWAASAIFVTITILALQHNERRMAGKSLTLRAILSAAAIGLGAGLGVTLVFQQIFLVHLP